MGINMESLDWGPFNMLLRVAQEFQERDFGKKVGSKRKLEARNPKPNPDPPALPQEFKDCIIAMGGSEPKLVLQKGLFVTDVAKNNCRLSMPVSECWSKIGLNEEEKRLLVARDDRGVHLVGIKVKVIAPNLELTELRLKKWHYNCNSSALVFASGWNKVVEKNKLIKCDEVQVWVFRADGDQFRFAVVMLPLKWGAKRRRSG